MTNIDFLLFCLSSHQWEIFQDLFYLNVCVDFWEILLFISIMAASSHQALPRQPIPAGRASVPGSRLRLIYCTIGTVILCAGVITLIAGIVIFILSSTPSSSGSSSTYMSDIFYYQSQNSENHIDQTSIIVAIVLASIGISFICLSFVFAMLACFAGNDNEPQQLSSTEMIYKQGGQRFLDSDDEAALMSPMIIRGDGKQVKPTMPLDEYSTPQPSSTFNKGDPNTIGLPSVGPYRSTSSISSESSRSRVPPNGFSYLAHPSEIQHFCDHRSMPVRHQRNKIMELPSKRESAI